MTNTLTVNERLKELLKDTSFDCYQYQDFEDCGELIESLQEEITREEVIYYDVAMEYLSMHDRSLKESLGLAQDLGYDLQSVNSELLATLLTHQNLSNELSKLISQIEACYEGRG